jgi:hypothetical protein
MKIHKSKYRPIDVPLAREWFTPDFDNGLLIWKQGRLAGQVAGTVAQHGYIVVDWLGKKHYAHRVLMAMYENNNIANKVVDHLNYKKNDNRISNLNLTTQRDNLLRKRTTGKTVLRYRGIEKKTNKKETYYLARFCYCGHIHYGTKQKTQRAAYRQHLDLFAKYAGVVNMCPKMQRDYWRL